MSTDDERYGKIVIDDNFSENKDPELRKKIIDATRQLQKSIGINGYIICQRCGQGISGDIKTTHPEYIAGFCKGDCKLLGLGEL